MLRRRPSARYFLGKVDEAGIDKLDPSERESLVRDLVAYPFESARLVFGINFVKAIPPLLVALYLVQPAQWLAHTALLFLLIFTANVYMFALQTIEGHSLASKILEQIHARLDLTSAFQKLDFAKARDEFRTVESWSFVLLGLSLAVQIPLLVFSSDRSNTSRLVIELTVVTVSSLVLIGRVGWASRRHFLKGFDAVFSVVRDYDPLRKVPQPLALHSTSVHARTEQIVNSLFDRIRGYEEELVRQVFEKAEERRYQSLGEMSALIVHDLASPLQAIHFLADRLSMNPQGFMEKHGKYAEQLNLNVGRMMELLQSLRSYLKNQKMGGSYISYKEAHEHALNLLGSRFHEQGVGDIEFDIHPDLATRVPALSQPDLIHVLMNVYSNAIDNMLSNKVPEPSLRVALHDEREHSFVVSVADSGTGLDRERFENMTGRAPRTAAREGLGLRLVRRLLQASGGDIQLHAPTSHRQGTTLLLLLPRRSSVQEASFELPT